MKFFQKNLPIIMLLAVSFLLHFAFLSYPSQVVFDETYYGQYSTDYLTHQFYFADMHPPLGKLIIAGFAKISNFQPGFEFDHISQPSTPTTFLTLRFMPALFGSLFCLLIYLLILQLGLSKKTAFFGAFLVTFDNALLVQSKFILLDMFLLCFGFGALYFFLKYQKESHNKKSWLFLIISAVLAACCLAVKWTGLSFLAIIFLLFFIDTIKKFNLKEFFLKLAILIFVPFLAYYLIFLVHFGLLYKSGSGDAYMSTQFQSTLIGNSVTQPQPKMTTWQKFIELNKKMYQYNATLTATHPYASKWYQWPFDSKPIWYWSDAKNDSAANIYLFGNPLLWLAVLLGIIFSVVIIFIKKIRQKLPLIFWVLLLAYFINILPFIFIHRVVFLYHYLASLVFGILILCILYEKIIAPWLINIYSQKTQLLIYYGFLMLCGLSFLLLCPLNYGVFIPNSSWLNNFYTYFIKVLS